MREIQNSTEPSHTSALESHDGKACKKRRKAEQKNEPSDPGPNGMADGEAVTEENPDYGREQRVAQAADSKAIQNQRQRLSPAQRNGESKHPGKHKSRDDEENQNQDLVDVTRHELV